MKKITLALSALSLVCLIAIGWFFATTAHITEIHETYSSVEVRIRGDWFTNAFILTASDQSTNVVLAVAERKSDGWVHFDLPIALEQHNPALDDLVIVTKSTTPKVVSPGFHIGSYYWSFKDDLWTEYLKTVISIKQLKQQIADKGGELSGLSALADRTADAIRANPSYHDSTCVGPLPPRSALACGPEESLEFASAMCVAAASSATNSCSSFARLLEPAVDQRIYNYLSGSTCIGLVSALSDEGYTLNELLGNIIVGQMEDVSNDLLNNPQSWKDLLGGIFVDAIAKEIKKGQFKSCLVRAESQCLKLQDDWLTTIRNSPNIPAARCWRDLWDWRNEFQNKERVEGELRGIEANKYQQEAALAALRSQQTIYNIQH